MSRRAEEVGKQHSEAAEAGAARRRASFLVKIPWEALVLVLLPVLLYLPSVDFAFVLDDKIVIEENRFVQEGIDGIGKILASESLAGFIGEPQNLVVGSRYRPLSLITFAVEHEWYGLKPAMSHLINVALYAITGLVLFRFFSVLTPGEAANPRYFRLPFVAALLFALHPLHSEVVANIKGRDEILALLFSLAALLLTFRYLRGRNPGVLVLSGLTFLLALLAKENAITFLAVAPLSMFFFATLEKRTFAIAMIPLVVSAAIYLLLRDQAVGPPLLGGGEEVTALMNNPFVEASTAQRYATTFYTWGLYLKLLIFPHPLTHDYYPYHVPLVGFADPRAIVSLVVYLVMAAFALLNLRKGNIASWSILYFLATFSIVSNLFFPIGTFMNERFIYMPSVGFCLALAWILSRRLPVWLGPGSNLSRALPVAVAVVFALGFSLKTFARVPDWESDTSLNRAGVSVSSGSARINCFMGFTLYEASLEEPDAARKQQLLDEAAFYLDRSLKIYPSYRDALNVYAGVLSSRYLLDGKIDVLLDGFFQILTENKPPHVDDFLNWLNGQNRHQAELADFYYRAGYGYYFQQLEDDAEAEKYLDFGYRVAPDNGMLLEALTSFWLARGDEHGGLKARRDAYKALKYAEEGIRLDPADRKFYEMAADAYAKLGDPTSAGLMRQQASRLSPP